MMLADIFKRSTRSPSKKTSRKKQCFKASWARKMGGRPKSSRDWGKMRPLIPFKSTSGWSESHVTFLGSFPKFFIILLSTTAGLNFKFGGAFFLAWGNEDHQGAVFLNLPLINNRLILEIRVWQKKFSTSSQRFLKFQKMMPIHISKNATLLKNANSIER